MVSRFWPDLKRLQALNACSVFRSEVPDLDSRTLGSKGFDSVAYRERCLATGRGFPAGVHGKLPDEMVEGGSHVLQAIPDSGTEGERWHLELVNPVNVLAAVRLTLVGDNVRFSVEEAGNFAIERFQMVLRPIQL